MRAGHGVLAGTIQGAFGLGALRPPGRPTCGDAARRADLSRRWASPLLRTVPRRTKRSRPYNRLIRSDLELRGRRVDRRAETQLDERIRLDAEQVPPSHSVRKIQELDCPASRWRWLDGLGAGRGNASGADGGERARRGCLICAGVDGGRRHLLVPRQVGGAGEVAGLRELR